MDCLKALDKQETLHSFEVLVIDCGSSQAEMAHIKSLFPLVKWHQSEVQNPYVARNIGIEEAVGDIIGFLDAKCQVASNWLDVAMAHFSDTNAVIVAGMYDVVAPSSKLKDLVYPLLYLNNEKNVEKGFGVTAGNLLVTKATFDLVGLFDTNHISGNDIKWTKKVLRLGHLIRYAPDVKVIYQGQSFETLKRSVKKYISGIFHQHNEESMSALTHVRQLLKYLLPMRTSYFNEALRYRGLQQKPPRDKCYLWTLVWSVKMRMGLHYLQCLIANGYKK